MTTATTGFCANCGAARPPGASFCGSCGQRFDAQAMSPAPEAGGVGFAAPHPATAPSLAGARKKGLSPITAIALLIAVGVLGAFAYNAVKGGSLAIPGVGPANANLPPAGSIWFGQSFDSSTFAIRSPMSTATAGQTFALVGNLTKSVDMSNANLRISLDGTTYVNQALGLSGEGDVYGATYTAPVAGSYRFEVTDVGGTVLATGTIAVR